MLGRARWGCFTGVLLAHLGGCWFQARFQLRPDDDDDDASSAYGVSFCGEACGVLLREGDFLGGMGAGSAIQLR